MDYEMKRIPPSAPIAMADWMGVHPVTNAQYQEFVKATGSAGLATPANRW